MSTGDRRTDRSTGTIRLAADRSGTMGRERRAPRRRSPRPRGAPRCPRERRSRRRPDPQPRAERPALPRHRGTPGLNPGVPCAPHTRRSRRSHWRARAPGTIVGRMLHWARTKSLVDTSRVRSRGVGACTRRWAFRRDEGQKATRRVKPPSTTTFSPVTQLAAGLERNAITLATSSGVPSRPLG